jgi:cytochrome c oxidase subunit 3
VSEVVAPQARQVAAQFDDADQQRQAATFGMWAFLASEVLFFGGLFAAYAVYRYKYPAVFRYGSDHQILLAGTINTGVLLTSSLTIVLAIWAVREGKRNLALGLLGATLLLGLTFVAIKSFEYWHKWEDGLVPGPLYHSPLWRSELYFSFYFVMTGLHLLHMLIGLGLVAVMAVLVLRGRQNAHRHNALENAGLYWHFVDVVWVFLYPLFYLVK